jgi:ABC-2 type transport system permease protein
MFVMKIQGTIVDLLVAPISYGEILAGFLGAATLRGLLVGGLTWLAAGLAGGFDLAHPAFTLAVLVLLALVFASFGLMTAIWATSFEQVNFFPTFIITPLTFLGGVFYSVRMIPEPLRRFTLLNPVFYMVDAVRFGILGRAEAHPGAGVAVLAGVALVAVGGALRMLRSGYKLRG